MKFPEKRAMMQIVKNRIIRLLIGFLGVLGLFQTIAITAEAERSFVASTNSFLSVWFCVLSAVLYDAVCQKVEMEKFKDIFPGFFYSAFLAAALTVGKCLETVENLNVGEIEIWLNILVLTIYFTPFVQIGWQWIEEIWKKEISKNNEIKKERTEFVLQWIFFFICWIPVFLAFYPGAFVYDAYDEYIQVAEGVYTTHHPLAHVLLLGKLVCVGKEFFGSYNTGIAIYTLLQMIILAGVFSYTVCFIKRKIQNKYIAYGSLLFYGFFPVIPMYAVCSSKDTIFTAAFLIVVIKMLQMLEDGEKFFSKKGNVAASIAATVIMMLFRNNGAYAYVVWIPIVIAGCFLTKKDRKYIVKITMLMLASFVVFQGCSKVLELATNADDNESQEIMTVPIQQMVRTYVYSPDTYSDEEKELLFEIIPEKEMHLYNARLSDLVKSKFENQNFNPDKAKYLQLWIKIGLRKPMIYLNAWLMTSYGYWYPDAVINVYGGNGVHTFTYQDSSYFGFETEPPGVRESKFPWLEEQYRKISLELHQQKIPGISMLFSPGFMFWVFMFCLCFLLQKREWDKVVPLTGILLLWATAILGPTYLVRYVLILWFAMPVIVTETKV